jgi:hypothetical protein
LQVRHGGAGRVKSAAFFTRRHRKIFRPCEKYRSYLLMRAEHRGICLSEDGKGRGLADFPVAHRPNSELVPGNWTGS